ncbi:hypothetical protein [Burkholderia stagnalis]
MASNYRRAGWHLEGRCCLSHPTGWTIAKCFLQGTPVYVLWEGDMRRGQFTNAISAMQEHRDWYEALAA